MKDFSRSIFFIFCVAVISLALTMPALGQEKKDKSDKVWGTLVAAPAEAAGKFSPVALETQKKDVIPLVNNAVAKKLEKLKGTTVEIEGKYKDEGGKKVLEPWIFVRKEKPDTPTKKP